MDNDFNKKICELPDEYTPSENEEFMSPMQLEFFRRMLLKWKEDITSNSGEVLRYLQEDTNPGTDFGDRATVETDLICELRTQSRATKLLSKIDAALSRIFNGTYGYCVETGNPIGIKRLIARPVATLCLEAQEAHEKKELSTKK